MGPGSGAGGAVMVPGGTAGASMTRMVAAGDTNTVGVGLGFSLGLTIKKWRFLYGFTILKC
jgi:hypothetical protein